MNINSLYDYINEIYNYNHPNLDKKVLDVNYWWDVFGGAEYWEKYRMG